MGGRRVEGRADEGVSGEKKNSSSRKLTLCFHSFLVFANPNSKSLDTAQPTMRPKSSSSGPCAGLPCGTIMDDLWQ